MCGEKILKNKKVFPGQLILNSILWTIDFENFKEIEFRKNHKTCKILFPQKLVLLRQ